jgi:hypothetical protein
MLTLYSIPPDLVGAQLMRAIQAQRSGLMLAQLVRRLRHAGAYASAEANQLCAVREFRNARQLFRDWRTELVNAHYRENVG